jgi:quinol monooxygenase YgiN
MDSTIKVTKTVTTLINILTVEPENQQKLIKLLRDNTESVVRRLDGWISTSFIAATDQRHVVIYSQWRDLASVEAIQTNPDMAEDRRVCRVRQPRWRRRLQPSRLMPGERRAL